MDIQREYDNQLYSPLVRPPENATGVEEGRQITFEIFRINLRFTLMYMINMKKNFIYAPLNFMLRGVPAQNRHSNTNNGREEGGEIYL